MTKLLRASISRHIITSALKIALLVGSILNIINQGDNLLDGATISWFHLLLNYLVPYCVASYSAAKNEIRTKDINAEYSR
ncbi:MAG: nitrate/nitrite transporter NrtS [Gallionellaceae bacterium]